MRVLATISRDVMLGWKSSRYLSPQAPTKQSDKSRDASLLASYPIEPASAPKEREATPTPTCSVGSQLVRSIYII